MRIPRLSTLWHEIGLPTYAQLVASGASVLLSIGLARNVSAEQMGVFSVQFATFTLLAGIVKSYATQPFVYLHANRSQEDRRPKQEGADSAAFWISLVCGTMVILSTWVWVGYYREVALFGLALPGLLLREHQRSMLVALRKGGIAAGLDSVVFFGCFALLPDWGWTLCRALVFWGMLGYATSLLGIFLMRTGIRPSIARTWLVDEHRDGNYFSADFLITNALSTGATYVVAALSGLAASGALRAAQTLLAPILMVSRGLRVSIAPLSTRLAQSKRHKDVWILSLGYGVAPLVAAMLAALLICVSPPEWIESILGESGAGALAVFPAAAMYTALFGVSEGATLGLRAYGEIRASLMPKIVTLPVSLVGLFAGSFVAGASGSQIGLAVGEFFRSVVAWASYRRRRIS